MERKNNNKHGERSEKNLGLKHLPLTAEEQVELPDQATVFTVDTETPSSRALATKKWELSEVQRRNR
jgi:hypothetical protein